MKRRAPSTVFVLSFLALSSGSYAAGQNLCTTGRSQSPIAINLNAVLPSGLHTPSPDYHPAGVVLWNDGGKTVQAQFAVSEGEARSGDNTLSVDGVAFRLLEFHIHRPGEHPVDGKVPDMEVHLVHGDASGKLAVLAVPVRVDKDAPDHDAFRPLLDSLPPQKDDRRQLPKTYDPNWLLPEFRTGFRYPGSLTTGACEEHGRWTVLQAPIVISKSQYDRYVAVFKLPHARPPQPANGRVPLSSLP